jgi:hypothetical protein
VNRGVGYVPRDPTATCRWTREIRTTSHRLTVGGELNKVAADIATGRNMAGVHWRTDCTQAVRLGEESAIGALREAKEAALEDAVFTLGRFDGTTLVICPSPDPPGLVPRASRDTRPVSAVRRGR